MAFNNADLGVNSESFKWQVQPYFVNKIRTAKRRSRDTMDRVVTLFNVPWTFTIHATGYDEFEFEISPISFPNCSSMTIILSIYIIPQMEETSGVIELNLKEQLSAVLSLNVRDEPKLLMKISMKIIQIQLNPTADNVISYFNNSLKSQYVKPELGGTHKIEWEIETDMFLRIVDAANPSNGTYPVFSSPYFPCLWFFELHRTFGEDNPWSIYLKNHLVGESSYCKSIEAECLVRIKETGLKWPKTIKCFGPSESGYFRGKLRANTIERANTITFTASIKILNREIDEQQPNMIRNDTQIKQICEQRVYEDAVKMKSEILEKNKQIQEIQELKDTQLNENEELKSQILSLRNQLLALQNAKETETQKSNRMIESITNKHLDEKEALKTQIKSLKQSFASIINEFEMIKAEKKTLQQKVMRLNVNNELEEEHKSESEEPLSTEALNEENEKEIERTYDTLLKLIEYERERNKKLSEINDLSQVKIQELTAAVSECYIAVDPKRSRKRRRVSRSIND